MTTTAISTSVVLLLLLGLLHTLRLVESFSSSLAQPKSLSATIVGSQQSIIQPEVLPLHYNTESLTAAKASHRSLWSSSALSVATGVAEETPDVSSGGDGDDAGLPEFGQDGLYHITNEDEYK